MNKEFAAILMLICLIGWLTGCEHPAKEAGQTPTESTTVSGVESVPINDAEWLKVFEQKANAYLADHDVTAAETYKEQLVRKSCAVDVNKPLNKCVHGEVFYKTFQKGVLMMGRVYKCGNCPENHVGVASAFVISNDGVCASNYHVFKSYDPAAPLEYDTYFVMDSEQNIYPVTEVLAASKHDDLSIFRIDKGDHELHPLALGDQKAPGASIHLISHPDDRYFNYTSGQINRHYIKPGTSKIRQSISAEFAKGSSGAPIMDDAGNVVGVVAGTQNIYYDPDGRIYQATIKEIIPASCLKALLE